MTGPFVINSSYNAISGIMVVPDGVAGKVPCVILSHGLVSSKESAKYQAVSERFAEAGIATCRFDYHGCGESGGKIEETTLSIRVENLERVLLYVRENPFVDPGRVGVIGSSFGGTTGLVVAARDPGIGCASFWATPFVLEKKEDETISEISFRDTIFSDFQSYNILGEATKVSRALILHGELDEVVPCAEGVEIFKNLCTPKECVIMEGADHVFSEPRHRERAITLALGWFGRFLL
jgi:dipeptidyl aminopeptidase/acylaminoacyl peptidase